MIVRGKVPGVPNLGKWLIYHVWASGRFSFSYTHITISSMAFPRKCFPVNSLPEFHCIQVNLGSALVQIPQLPQPIRPPPCLPASVPLDAGQKLEDGEFLAPGPEVPAANPKGLDGVDLNGRRIVAGLNDPACCACMIVDSLRQALEFAAIRDHCLCVRRFEVQKQNHSCVPHQVSYRGA